MNIHYLDHSGFAVNLQNRLFVFDYANLSPADGSTDEGIINADFLKKFDAVYFFVSHSHGDHFNKKIYSLASANPNTRYIISSDVTQDRNTSFTVLTKGKTYRDPFLSVHAFGSTDIGISFLIESCGKKIFHAGDLNCWHWSGEWSSAEENEARAFYEQELSFLAPYAEGIDLAFLPVDPRMHGNYDDGARIFAERFSPKTIVPMHCWGKYSVIDRFRAEMSHKNINILTYHKRGEILDYHD